MNLENNSKKLINSIIVKYFMYCFLYVVLLTTKAWLNLHELNQRTQSLQSLIKTNWNHFNIKWWRSLNCIQEEFS